ncbi:MAG: vitamin K epoxide reductase family protein [Dehalococcoidia bacterium]
MALAGVGAGISGYLTVSHLLGKAPVCGPSHGCAIVQNSPYATLWGVPVALLGLLLYIALVVLPLAEVRFPRVRVAAPLASLTLALGGLVFSAYLTWLEVFVILAICWWCVASAVVIALLTPVAFWRASQGLS